MVYNQRIETLPEWAIPSYICMILFFFLSFLGIGFIITVIPITLGLLYSSLTFIELTKSEGSLEI